MSDTSRSGMSQIKRDLIVSARAFGSSFRNPDLARAQIAFVAFSVTEWASYIAVVVYAFGQEAPPPSVSSRS